jgi:hypothetical protein
MANLADHVGLPAHELNLLVLAKTQLAQATGNFGCSDQLLNANRRSSLDVIKRAHIAMLAGIRRGAGWQRIVH